MQNLIGSVPMNRDQPLFEIVSMVKKPEDIGYVRDEIYRTLEEFKTTPVEASRLRDLKRRNKYSFLMTLDTPDAVAGRLARFVALTGDIAIIDTLYARMDAITPEDIMRAAKKYFTPERRTVVVLKEAGHERRLGSGCGVPPQKIRNSGGTPLPRMLSAALVLVFASIAGHAAPAPVLLPVANDPTVAFRLWFKVGAQNDPAGKEGLAALTAAMLTDASTQRHRYEQILDKLFPLASSYSASSSTEMTVINGRTHRDNLADYYPLLIDAVLAPAFKQEDLERIRSRTLNLLENTLRFASDEELGKAVLYNEIFAGTPYGHIVPGTIEAVKGITLDDLRKFYAAHFTRDNVVIGLGGGYAPSLVEQLKADLAKLPVGAPAIIGAAPGRSTACGSHWSKRRPNRPRSAWGFRSMCSAGRRTGMRSRLRIRGSASIATPAVISTG